MSDAIQILLKKVNKKLTDQVKSKTDFARELNKYLPSKMKITVTPQTMVKVYNWLSGKHHNANAVLAMEQWLKDQK